MKKKVTEPGLLYVQKVGIKPAKDMHKIYSDLAAKFGKADAEKFLETLLGFYKNGEIEKRYEYKNADIDKCMIFTGGFDADIIRKACNWIDANKDAFGVNILDVGCDCGIVSCFLGLTFPEAKILSIDRGENGIKIAKQLAQKLNVKNVEFRVSSLEELADRDFDTVFTMRTMQENKNDCEEDLFNDLGVQADIFSNDLSRFARGLASKLTENGCFIGIEKVDRNALFLGWIDALMKNVLSFDLERYREQVCTETEDSVMLQAFVCSKVSDHREDSRDVFRAMCEKYVDFSLAEYSGWDATVLYFYKRGELINGYTITDTKNETKAEIALWTHRDDETGLVLYQNNNGQYETQFYDISRRDDLSAEIERGIGELRRFDYINIEPVRL